MACRLWFVGPCFLSLDPHNTFRRGNPVSERLCGFPEATQLTDTQAGLESGMG